MSSRVDYLERAASPRIRLLALSGLILALVLAANWLQALALMVFGYFLALLAGKRIQLLYFFGLAASIVFFSLLNPFGRVLWQWGALTFTQGALEEGLSRAFRLIGMVFASVAGIHRRLSFPGPAGRFLATTLAFYDRLLESRRKLSLKRWVDSADEVLFEVFPLDGTLEESPNLELPQRPKKWKTLVFVAVIWFLSLLPLVLTLFL